LPHFATLPIDLVRVVGRDRPEEVHVLLGDETLAQSEQFIAFAAGHSEMLAAYRARRWDEAEALRLRWLDAATGFALDKLYALYGERIANYRAHDPGHDWDGVFSATEK
jgi:adenylate cyclase